MNSHIGKLRLPWLLVLAVTRVSSVACAADPVREEWKIDGLAREALIHLPNKPSDAAVPVVFGFHGHGGSMRNAARSFRLHEVWPEAIVVYMQGLPTAGRLTDPEGKLPGWQFDPGEQGDRDLKFFDAVLKTLRGKYKVDADRVYATGHSNGGAFTYLLWAERPDVFAAFAPSAAGSRSLRSLKPKPAMHIAGENDQLVRFAGQQLTMKSVRRINGCEEAGQEWAKGCTLYPSDKGTPFVSFIHSGDHKYPADAPALIVRFFKEHSLPAGPGFRIQSDTGHGRRVDADVGTEYHHSIGQQIRRRQQRLRGPNPLGEAQ